MNELSELEHRSVELAEVVRHAWASNTRRTYLGAWRGWEAWCAEHGCDPLSGRAADVSLYVVHRARVRSIATVRVDMAAIGHIWAGMGIDVPTSARVVRLALRGVVRASDRPIRRARPFTVEQLVRAVRETSPRDRALLLAGFAGAMRRSELVGFTVDDVDFRIDGAVVQLRQAKTGPRRVGLPRSSADRCPVAALEAWIAIRGPGPGPVFAVDPRTVARVVQRAAGRLGLAPGEYSGHSLRAGLATAAARAEASPWQIATHTGHADLGTLYRYIRDGEILGRKNAARVALDAG